MHICGWRLTPRCSCSYLCGYYVYMFFLVHMYMYFYVYMYMCLSLRVSMIYSVCLHTCVCVDHRNSVWEKPLFSDYLCFDIFYIIFSSWNARAEEISYIYRSYIYIESWLRHKQKKNVERKNWEKKEKRFLSFQMFDDSSIKTALLPAMLRALEQHHLSTSTVCSIHVRDLHFLLDWGGSEYAAVKLILD